MPSTRPRRRWMRWLVTVLVLVIVAGLVAWWLQRQATDLAAQVLARATATSPQLPELPPWPLETPAALPADAEPFDFDPARPTLVVLLHGMSPSPEIDERVDSHAFARHYWGHAFVRALLGGHDLERVDGAPLRLDRWVSDAPPGNAAADGLVLPVGDGDDGGTPRRAALLVTRDGSRSLGDQATAAARQIAQGLEAFSERAGADAQVVLIGHSMGGLVARHLLTNPPIDDGPFGVPERTRDDIDRIRDRTLYLLTLGTPHEGSQAADRAMLLAQVEHIVVDEMVRPNAFARRWLLPLLQETASYLRLDDPATQHLRSDVWEALNDPDDGLLAPHRARRGDGSLVPVYALASRAPGGRFFVDPLVSARIELELALWYAEQLGIDAEAYVRYTLQMLLADPTMYTLGVPTRGWGRVDDHPAPAEVLDLVTRVPTAPERVAFGTEDARFTIELSSRVDFLRGPHVGEVPTRDPLERVWCLFVRCSDESFVFDVGSVDDVDLSHVDDPTVALVRDLVLRRRPAGDTDPLGSADGRVGDGDIDADGLVPVDSALGLLLGGREWAYLAAGRTWVVGDETLPGSWYRPDLDDPGTERPWTYLHHIDQQYDPAVAQWIAETLLGAAGPEAGPLPLSGWR